MNFLPINHQYKTELENELCLLENFAGSITCLKANPVIADVNRSVSVFFDDDNKPYVSSNIDSCRDNLKKIWEDIRSLQNHEARDLSGILGHILDVFPRFDDAYYPLYDDQHWQDEEVKRKIKEIRDIISDAHEGYDVNGEYNFYTKEITLYTQNIGNNIVDYISVFAHEYFHAIHHFLISRNSNEHTNRYYHSVVLESLASYFQIEYLRTKGSGFKLKAEELEKLLHSKSPIYYPNSGAKYITNDFCDILEDSLKDFKAALYRLINNPLEAEIILNKKKPRIMGRSNGLKTPTGKTAPEVPEKKSTVSPECPSVFPQNSRIGDIPLFLIPHNENTFKGMYEDGHPYMIVLYYTDGKAEMIGPVKCNGKPVKSPILNHIKTNPTLKKKDLSNVRSIVASIMW